MCDRRDQLDDLGAARNPALAGLQTAEEFEAWVRPHWGAMARLAARLAPVEWEDVLQDALVVAWRKRRNFDQRRGSATSWLLALTVDQARKARRRSVVQQRTLLAEPEHAPSARDLDVEHALDRLSRRQRIAVELYYFLGLPVKEIAAVMSCSEGTVKSTVSDARRRLRTILGEQFYELQ